jgi:ribonucleotide reductase beta subunit family protein with ferritin-like domain
VTREIARYINSPDYQSLKTDEEKRYLLQRELNYFRAEANNRVLNQNKYLEKSEIERISKALFFKLGKEERKYAMSLYEQSTGNKLVDTLDYQHALAILQDKKKRDRASARPRR